MRLHDVNINCGTRQMRTALDLSLHPYACTCYEHIHSHIHSTVSGLKEVMNLSLLFLSITRSANNFIT